MSARLTLIVTGGAADAPVIGEGWRRSACEVIALGRNVPDVDAAVARATAPTVAVVEAGSTLDGNALAKAVEATGPFSGTAIVYTDERVAGRVVRKPPWLARTLEREDYLGRMVLLPRALAAMTRFGADPDEAVRRLVLRADACGIEVRHVPVVAHDGPARPTRVSPCLPVTRRPPVAAPAPGRRPEVSVLLPTAGTRVDDGRRPSVRALRALDAVRRAADPATTEVVVVVGPEVDRPALAAVQAFEGLRPRVVVDHLPFDFSRRINLAAAHARGSVLLLLNDDVERDADDAWLAELVALARLPGIGAVGAKLLYPDRSVQHAGVWLHDGFGRHIGRSLPEDAPGPEGWFTQPRELSAVTGAVLATPADVFAEVGGLTEALPVNWNDIDYCLKVRSRGHRVVWTPRATLLHDESSTRSPGVSAEEMATWRRRWPVADERYWGWLDDQGTVPAEAAPAGAGATPSAAR